MIGNHCGNLPHYANADRGLGAPHSGKRQPDFSIMFVAVFVFLLVMVTLGVVTTIAFSWAASNRQFENMEDASRVIFDADECVGRPTDPALQREKKPERPVVP